MLRPQTKKPVSAKFFAFAGADYELISRIQLHRIEKRKDKFEKPHRLIAKEGLYCLKFAKLRCLGASEWFREFGKMSSNLWGMGKIE